MLKSWDVHAISEKTGEECVIKVEAEDRMDAYRKVAHSESNIDGDLKVVTVIRS